MRHTSPGDFQSFGQSLPQYDAGGVTGLIDVGGLGGISNPSSSQDAPNYSGGWGAGSFGSGHSFTGESPSVSSASPQPRHSGHHRVGTHNPQSSWTKQGFTPLDVAYSRPMFPDARRDHVSEILRQRGGAEESSTPLPAQQQENHSVSTQSTASQVGLGSSGTQARSFPSPGVGHPPPFAFSQQSQCGRPLHCPCGL